MIEKVLGGLAPPDPGVELVLRTYYDDLIRFNRGQNLISRQDAERRAAVLIGEACLAATAQNINKNEYVLDLGSGAGIPGIPTAVWVEGLRVALLDRRGARCDFLRREVRALRLSRVEVHERDATVPGGLAARFDRVLLKAVAAPSEALELARPFLAPGGRAVLYREASWNPKAVGGRWRLERHSLLSAAWTDRELGVYQFLPA